MFFSKTKIKKNFCYSTILLLFGRFFGILQDKALMMFFKTSSVETDVFFVSARIPSFFRQMFGEKLLGVSITPEFVSALKKNNKKQALELLTSFLILTIGFSLIVIFLCYNWPLVVIKLFAPGFSVAQNFFVNKFFPKMLGYILFILCCEVLSVGLRSTNNFFAPALGPVIFHLTMIAMIFFTMYFNLSSALIAFGFSFGAFVKFVIRYIVFRKQGLYFVWPTITILTTFLSILKKMLPLLCVLSLVQVSFLTEGIVGSFLPTGNITQLHYIFRLYNVFMIVLTIPLGTVFLPNFSELFLASKKKLFFVFYEISKVILWVGVPATNLLIIFSPQLIAFIHNKSLLDSEIIISAVGLSILSFGLIFTIFNTLFTTLFFAMKQPSIPSIVQSSGTIINIAGGFLSLKFLGLWGIVLTTTISSIFSTIILLFFSRNIGLPLKKIYKFLKLVLFFPINIPLVFLAILNLFFLFQGKLFFTRIEFWQMLLGTILVLSCIFFIPQIKLFAIKKKLNLFFLK